MDTPRPLKYIRSPLCEANMNGSSITMSVNEKLLCKIMKPLPMSILAEIAGTRLIIPYYHMVSDKTVDHTKHLYHHKGISQFKNDIEYLLRNARAIDVDTLIGFVKGKIRLNGKHFLLTFDDGFREMHDIVAPILLRMGVPAVFFMASAFIDNKELCYDHKKSLLAERIDKGISAKEEFEIKRILETPIKGSHGVYREVLKIPYEQSDILNEMADVIGIDFCEYLAERQPYLTSESIRELVKSGFGFGAHSIDHPLYSSLSLDEQLRQTKESMTIIKERFGLCYGAFSFPHGDTGVTRRFFQDLSATGLVDISFGIGGLIHDTVMTNIQRVSFENPLMPAKDILKTAIAKKVFKVIRLKGSIKRR